MREDDRDDKEMREGWIRIFQLECDRCPYQNREECLGYGCSKWDNGWAIEIIPHDGRNINYPTKIVKSGLSFKEIKSVYPEVLRETRRMTRERIKEKYKKYRK